MNANRFYLLGILAFVSYISFSYHVITDVIRRNNDFLHTYRVADFLNRGIVATKLDDKRFCRAPRIAIIVSPHPRRFLQLYWDVEYTEEGEWIGLFQEDPQSGKIVFPIYTIEVRNTTGLFDTNITYTLTNFSSENQFLSKCSHFWAAYFTVNGSASAISCVKTNPTWMYDMRNRLGDMQIKRLFIPGTHNSGSYLPQKNSASLTVMERYVFTQDEDILSQLIHGIRYLDLRVSSNPQLPDRWWINHGLVKIQPLKHILSDVKKFLKSTREIVILDFHGFPAGFRNTPGTHQDLIHYLVDELDEWLAPPNWKVTCKDLWNINKTLILSYNHEDTVKENPSLLWAPVSQKWANVQNIGDLKEYFGKIIDSRPSYSWAAMAELTPTLWSIVTYQTNSLREMAQDVNPHVTNWFRGTWGRICNIVAVDFFKGTDIIEAAIEWNIRRTEKRICDIH